MSGYCVVQTYEGIPRKLVVKTKATNALISQPFIFDPNQRVVAEERSWQNMSTFSFQEAVSLKEEIMSWKTAILDELCTFVIPAALIFYNPKRSFKTFKSRR